MYTKKQLEQAKLVFGLTHYVFGILAGAFIGWLIWG